MKNPKIDNPRLSEGIILALSSAGAYLFTFYYEKGYASIFRIPTSLIGVSLSSILILGAILIGLFIFILPSAILWVSFAVSGYHPAIKRAAMPVIIVFLLLLVQIYVFGLSNWEYWQLILILFVIVFLQFVFPLLTQRGKTYTKKLEAQEETERRFTGSYAISQNKYGIDLLSVIVIFLIGIYIALSAGAAEAINQWC